MRFEYPKKNYLIDGGGDIVNLQPVSSVYETLRLQGYYSLDTSYDKKVYIEEQTLIDEFDPLENTITIDYQNEGDFSYDYIYWMHKSLEFYLNVSKLEYNENTDETQSIDGNYYRIQLIIYHPDTDIPVILKKLEEVVVKKLESKNKIDIIIQTQRGYEFKEHEIKSPEIDLDTMYNEDFTPVYDHIVDKLNNDNKGVVLLYGEPGTGKTSLIKHLTTVVKHKFVFVPISMIGHVSSPQFIGDLVKNKGGILVLEDCENFIQDRKVAGDSVVSPLLQITDGILSDILDIKIICTFNTDLTKVDEALRREGRLIAEYEFKELSDDRAEILAGHPVKGKKTLANIFNKLTYTDNVQEEKTIGFKR